jgi:hypothetical protein
MVLHLSSPAIHVLLVTLHHAAWNVASLQSLKSLTVGYFDIWTGDGMNFAHEASLCLPAQHAALEDIALQLNFEHRERPDDDQDEAYRIS